MTRLSLAHRVTALTAIAVGIAVAVTSLAAYVTLRHQLYSSLDSSLLNRATAAADAGLVPEATMQQIPSAWLGAADVRFATVRADGSVYLPPQEDAGNLVLGQPELAVARGRDPYAIRSVRSSDGVDYRVVTVPTQPGTALALAQTLEPTQDTLGKLGVVMLIVGGLGVVVAGAFGMGVARSGLRPVRRLTSAAEEVARTDQLRPIAVSGSDEIARLAAAFNEMLTALGASRERQRQLVADAGHELRTPLTSLRTNIDLLTQADAQGGLDPQSRQELLTDVRSQLEELTILIHDLVQLARDEPSTAEPESVDLADIVDHAVDRVRRRAGSVDFDVHVEPWPVIGEPQTLDRAVVNLLDNAVKWSPPGGVVTVRLVNGVLDVADQGRGISGQDLPHIFERFYRASEARRLPGSGLGLAIVRQAAERHGGSIDAGRTPEGGAIFRLTLPAAERGEAGERAQPHATLGRPTGAS
ncbi:MAG TPA: HAMP domain-containing sensor histidine kinase [Nocardioidaceae bacterium]|nr:HAMP domain-containing sensor histidine kinase [Nocardioidaceae bacterium]